MAWADADPFAANYNSSRSFTSYSLPHQHHHNNAHTDSIPSKRGLLVAASDALGFKFGRRRKSVRQPPIPPIILPDVIEISAPHRDEEVEERERLRDAAAQSIGLGPVLLQECPGLNEESLEEADEDGLQSEDTHHLDDVRTLEHGRLSPASSQLSSTIGQHQQPLVPVRHRAGSRLAHSRTNSVSVSSVPPFPTTHTMLKQFIHTCSTLPKYYPPSSLRIFALSKQWKSRFIVLSCPTALPNRGSAPAVSYLHLFKSAGAEEKEIERLEINEDSVVFVAEEEVGARRNVVKVGGVDVGTLRKEWNYEEGGRTMWLLHITNAAEAQKWIASIKNAILGQRSMRAGLGLPAHTLGGIEPRGDMDVMLTMRAQGITTSSITNNPDSVDATTSLTSSATHKYASSVSSHSMRSQSTLPRPTSPNTVSALKGLFTGSTRSRSPSRAATLDQDREVTEESFGSMGSNLLSLSRTNGDAPASPTASMNGHVFSPPNLQDQRIDRKIVSERQSVVWPPTSMHPTPGGNARSLSIGSLSLLPPPRKRWTTSGPPPVVTDKHMLYKHTNGNASIAGSFGVKETVHEDITLGPPSPTLSGLSSTQEQRQRAPSLQSVSTFASGENGGGLERSSSSKRWSRQGSLPKRLTPPNGPPPLTPHARLHPHPYAVGAERPPSRTSSVHSALSQKSIISGLPSFSKRASASSVMSVNTVNSAHQPQTQTQLPHTNGISLTRSGSTHRTSIPPPPRPVPSFAPPPPPPDYDNGNLNNGDPQSSSRSSFRDSAAHRAFRLSLLSPKPPPSAVLPPRPDEVEHPQPRKSTSTSNHNSELYPIPDSPIPPDDTPQLLPVPEHVQHISRHASIKDRLRILSAPSSAGGSPPAAPSPRNHAHHRPATLTLHSPTRIAYSQPASPIGERITNQNDLDFIHLYTPVTASAPTPKSIRSLPPPPDQYANREPELTSLSPPPRRGSRQISILERDSESSEVTLETQPEVENKFISLSHHGSVISLGIVG